MRIKKLSIVGFKSIMDKLEIHFPMGISGVVGPNGCGKSNIVDAIRWCLGEQSPKELRGRKMEDVIFSGTGQHKPLGMAEVSITFENGDGTFPRAFAAHSELSVTRRLFRSGESEYRLNNVPCRLKDIQEVFMDTGLGNRAYSVIGQGKIGTILEQKPEQTRMMLEEAAGITKYRKKVVASQRKIELTQANLQRVEDILGEVQRQMRSLKRQAAKAKRYKAIGEQIRQMQLVLYSHQYAELSRDSDDRQRAMDQLVQEEMALAARDGELAARIDHMHLELEEKDAALAHLRRREMEVSEALHRKQASLESMAAEIRMQEEMDTRLAGEAEELQERLVSLEEERGRLQEKQAAVKAQAVELKNESAARETRFRSRREALEQIRQGYEQAREALNAGTHREMGLAHETSYLEKMIQQITTARSRLEEELREAEQRMEQITAASRRRSRTREAAAEKLRRIDTDLKERKAAAAQLEHERVELEGTLRSKESEMNACQSRLASLQALTENFEGYQMGVRAVMKAQDLPARREGRILGLLADFIQVEPAYEQAVEAVLADRLQVILVESQADGRMAVDYLKAKAKGRVSLVPIKEFEPRPAHPAHSPDSQCLLEFVSTDEAYRPVLQALLGNTWLVPDLDAALEAWKRNGRDRCFVTPEGDLVDAHGIISGGKLARTRQGLLARKREIEHLRKQSRQYAREVDTLRNNLEGITAELEEQRRSLDQLGDEKWRCHEEITEHDKALFRLGQELDQLDKLCRKIREDLERRNREEDRHRKDLLAAETQLKECRDKKTREEIFFQHKEAELREAQAEFDSLREEVAEVQSNLRLLEEEQRSLVRETEHLEDFVDEARERLRRIETDRRQASERREECISKRQALEAEVADRYELLEQAQKAVQRAERERTDFFGRIKEEENRAQKLRAEIEAVRQSIQHARMEHSEIELRMKHLRETVSEKLRIDLDAAYRQHLQEDFNQAEMERRIERQRELRRKLGEVNLTAISEHEALKERYEFMTRQRDDLLHSIESLRTAIRKINKTSLEKFQETFEAVDSKLKEIFPILFNGGTASLRLIDESQPLESGVLVEVQPPGKKLSHMGLLSGGEKALVAMALLFAIYMIKPSPFCLLDEVDSPLDEANIERFNNLLREIKKSSQIIMVTHNRRTMEITDRLFGVTMEKAGVSKLVSVDLETYKHSDTPPSPHLHAVQN